MPRSSSRGSTLLEMMIFGAIGCAILLAVIGLLSRAGRLLEFSRRTSSSQGDLKVLLETMSEDAAELLSFDGEGLPYDSRNVSPSAFSLVIRSTRVESGLAPTGVGINALIQLEDKASTGGTGLRRVEYKLAGRGTLRDCIRTVTALDFAGKPAGPQVTRRIVPEGMLALAIWPVAAIPQGKSYRLSWASNLLAHSPGATPACLVVDASAGMQGPGNSDLEKSPITALVTKLWCRNRVMELARGVLQ